MVFSNQPFHIHGAPTHLLWFTVNVWMRGNLLLGSSLTSALRSGKGPLSADGVPIQESGFNRFPVKSSYLPDLGSWQQAIVSGELGYEAFFVCATRIALRASPQTKGPFLWIDFRKIHPSTVTRTYDSGRHIPFHMPIVTVN
jgi:hypothetical protein